MIHCFNGEYHMFLIVYSTVVITTAHLRHLHSGTCVRLCVCCRLRVRNTDAKCVKDKPSYTFQVNIISAKNNKNYLF